MTTPWHENDAFWQHMAGVIFSARRQAVAPTEAAQIIALAKLEPGATILDLPCGTGRHSIEFARQGFRVTGVDLTQTYLDEARKRADEAGVTLEFVREDMRRFTRPGAFDLALNLFTSFGYFRDPADEAQVLANFHACLEPGGRLIMDLMGREVVARQFQERDWIELDDGGVLLEQREILEHWTWNRMRWIYTREGVKHEHLLELRLYTADQLMALLARAGFEQIEAFGNYEGAPYDHEAKRLVVTARRPG